jgi:serine/threonine protein kinase
VGSLISGDLLKENQVRAAGTGGWPVVAFRHPMTDKSHPLIGTTLANRYRVERVIGKGGMGVVLEATHVDLGERFAVKLLLPDAARTKDSVERFFQEAKAAASLKSPHIARVSDFGRLEDGSAYLIMEFLEGVTLGQRLEESGSLAPEEAVTILYQACLGVMVAHENRIVHRDLKPDNLFLVRERNFGMSVKVLDFGISKKLDDAKNMRLTQTGAIFGSPLYMSPEQLRDTASVDARSDVWSLGAVLHEALCGKPPFEGSTMHGLMYQILDQPALDLRTQGVPEEIAAIVDACLQKNRDSRPADAHELAALLEPYAVQKQVARGLSIPVPSGSAPQMQGTKPRSKLDPDASNRFESATTMREVVTDPNLAAALQPKRRRWTTLSGVIAAVTALGAVSFWATRETGLNSGQRGPVVNTAVPLLSATGTPTALASSAAPPVLSSSAPTNLAPTNSVLAAPQTPLENAPKVTSQPSGSGRKPGMVASAPVQSATVALTTTAPTTTATAVPAPTATATPSAKTTKKCLPGLACERAD